MRVRRRLEPEEPVSVGNRASISRVAAVGGRSSFDSDVAAVLRHLRPGDLVTYGEVALEAGHPGAARAVGSLLRDAAPGEFPWWRVVTSTGRLVPGHEAEQAERLRSEGFEVTGNRVVPPTDGGDRRG